MFFLITCISNAITITIIKISFLTLSAKFWLSRLFNLNSNFLFDAFLQTKSNDTKQSAKSKSQLTLTQNCHLNQEVVNVCYSLSKVNLALGKLQDSHTFDKFILSLKLQTHTPLELLLTEIADLNYREGCE